MNFQEFIKSNKEEIESIDFDCYLPKSENFRVKVINFRIKSDQKSFYYSFLCKALFHSFIQIVENMKKKIKLFRGI